MGGNPGGLLSSKEDYQQALLSSLLCKTLPKVIQVTPCTNLHKSCDFIFKTFDELMTAVGLRSVK